MSNPFSDLVPQQPPGGGPDNPFADLVPKNEPIKGLENYNIIDAVAHGMSLGASDKFAAAQAALRDEIQGTPETFKERFAKNFADRQAQREAYKATQSTPGAVAEFAAGVAPFALAPEIKAAQGAGLLARAAGRAVGGGLVGAGAGAIQAAAEAPVGSEGQAALGGAGVGGAFGALGGVVIPPVLGTLAKYAPGGKGRQAARAIAGAAGFSPEELASKSGLIARKLAAGEPITLAQLGDPVTAASTFADIASKSGKARKLLDRFITSQESASKPLYDKAFYGSPVFQEPPLRPGLVRLYRATGPARDEVSSTIALHPDAPAGRHFSSDLEYVKDYATDLMKAGHIPSIVYVDLPERVATSSVYKHGVPGEYRVPRNFAESAKAFSDTPNHQPLQAIVASTPELQAAAADPEVGQALSLARSLLKRESGVSVPSPNPVILAQAKAMLQSNPSLLGKLGNEAFAEALQQEQEIPIILLDRAKQVLQKGLFKKRPENTNDLKIASATQAALKTLIDAADAAVPEYGQARATASTYKMLQKAVRTGRVEQTAEAMGKRSGFMPAASEAANILLGRPYGAVRALAHGALSAERAPVAARAAPQLLEMLLTGSGGRLGGTQLGGPEALPALIQMIQQQGRDASNTLAPAIGGYIGSKTSQ